MPIKLYDCSQIQGDNEHHRRMRYIFGVYFRVRLKAMYLYQEEIVNQVGVPTTMDAEMDYQIANGLQEAQITIADMAELFHEEKNFEILRFESLREIYQHIRDYLEIATEALNEQYYTDTAVREEHFINFIEDLKKLEDLANAIFPIFMKFEVKQKQPIARGFGFCSTQTTRSVKRFTDQSYANLSQEDKRVYDSYKLDMRNTLAAHIKDQARLWLRRD